MFRPIAAGSLLLVLLLIGCQATQAPAPASAPAPPSPPAAEQPAAPEPVNPTSPEPAKPAPVAEKPLEPSPAGDLMLSSIDMVNAQVGWGFRLDHFGLYRTADGGSHWKEVTPPEATGNFDADLAALSPDRAWLILTYRDPGSSEGFAKVVTFRTADGGDHWERSEFATDLRSTYGGSISVLSEQQAFVLVEMEHGSMSRPGVLYRTDDGGRNWALVARADLMPYAGRLRFADPQTGWVVGHQVSTTPEKLAFTSDGGRTWTEPQGLNLPADSPPGQVSVLNPPVPMGSRLMLTATFRPESHRADDFRLLLYTSSGPGAPWELLTHLPYSETYAFLPSGHGWVWSGKPRDPGTKRPIAGTFHVTQDGGASGPR